MNPISKKETTVKFNKRYWFRQPICIFSLFILLVTIIYVMFLRHHLMPSMSTSTVELIGVGILALCFCLTILAFLITLIILLFILIKTHDNSKITHWVLKLRRRLTNLIILGLLLTIFVFSSQRLAYTPPILGDNENPLPSSISELEKVTLGKSQQWITIRGKDINKPVLLFLAGGPGGTQLAATRSNLKALEEYFVVVNWDQPGSGKSYYSVPIKELTPERYISDAHELTNYLRARFNKDKIYIVGESWGSALGILLAQRYPELYYSFVGTGQMISFKDTETMCYELALKVAQERGDEKKINELRNQGVPPYYGKDVVWKESAYLMYLSNYMAKNPSITNAGYNTLGDMAGSEYGLLDKINFARGVVTTFNHVYQQLYEIDFRKQAVKINIPVYFLEGRHDINAPPPLVEEYYNTLESPHKELIWFEHSGHSPWINESDKFVDTLVKLVEKDR